MSSPAEALEKRCAHCGITKNISPVLVQGKDHGGWATSFMLCPSCVNKFWDGIHTEAMKFTAHPTIRGGVAQILQGLHDLHGLDLAQPDLAQTPERVARMLGELCAGLRENAADYLKVQYPAPKPPNLIVTRRIDFVSLCIHHFAVMSGYAFVGYIPKEHIVGLSKIARVVNAFAKRPQLQERLTNQIADCVNTILKPQGVIVVVSAQHSCMCSRGVLKKDAVTEVCAVRGIFRTNDAGCKDEFFEMLKMGREE